MAIDAQNPAIYHTDDPTAPGRILFHNVITPKAQKKNGKEVGDPKYDVTLGFTPTSSDFAAIKALAVKVALEKWPGRKIGEQAKTGDFAFPFSSGDKDADKAKIKGKDMEFARGLVLLKARSAYQPNLSVLEGGKVKELFDEAIKANAGKFYRGVNAGVTIELRAYEGGTGPDGVSARLYKVISLNKGDRLGGQRSSSAEAFKGYAGHVTDEDPTAGMDLDDEIAF